MSLKSKVKQIKEKKLTATENVMNFSKKIATKDIKDLNIILTLNENAIEEAKEIDKRIKDGKEVGKLAGLGYTVKANISVKGLETNCASEVLQGYVSPYNATVINKLKSEDAIILGIVNMDEFACGGSGETSFFGPTKNPKNPELIPGGTSSGSAASVAAEICDFSLGSDTGGSIRNPASQCGVVGLKPTYGAVSRYGLLDMTMSFDCIGPLTHTSEDSKFIFEVIKGQDNFDQTTKEKNPKRTLKGTMGVVELKGICDKDIEEIFNKRINEIAEKNSWKIKKINLPLDISLEAYYIIVYTEFFSATRKYDGRRFGKKIEEFAGPEVVRRIIGGSEITKAEFDGKYYKEALKARNYLKEEMKKVFGTVDAILMPTVPKTPHKIGEEISVEDMYAYDIFTTLSSITGIPTISLPLTKIDNKDIGLQILTPSFEEDLIFKLAKNFE